MPIAQRASLAIPIILSLLIHAALLAVGEMVSRRSSEAPRQAPLQAQYRLPDGEALPSGAKEAGDGKEEGGATISLDTPDPTYRPYFKVLRNGIAERWEQPQLAEGDPTSGSLLVEFTIESAGELRDVSVARSSGVMGFDFAAVRAVKRAVWLASAPPEVKVPSASPGA